MSIDAGLTFLFIVVLCGAAVWQFFLAGRRTGAQVAEGLLDHTSVKDESDSLNINGEQFNFSKDAGVLGLFRPAAFKAFERRVGLIPWYGALVAIAFRAIAISWSASTSVTVALAILGLAIGYLISQGMRRAQSSRWERRCQFCLPLTMERLVMGVQSGLDLLAALSVILKDEEQTPTDDPILELLSIVMKLTESGLPFEQALKEVSSRVPLTAIRHAFTHLAIAHKEGGELVMPLKELSDATQSFYQETIEEEIARLPVKATLPLLCTFAGLIIFFITSPLIQVINMTAGVTGGMK